MKLIESSFKRNKNMQKKSRLRNIKYLSYLLMIKKEITYLKCCYGKSDI